MARRKRDRPQPQPQNQIAHVESLADELDGFDAAAEVRRIQNETISGEYARRRSEF